MEKEGSFKKPAQKKNSNIEGGEFMTSPRASTLEDELDEDFLIENS
jgi:hypothetical protein